ncbi:MAG: RidA family protein [Haliea sp.]|nr:MAG: RidA family protein [Haliea sp.]
MLEMINPAAVPASPFYSQGVVATAPQRMLFISGQVGVDAKGMVGKDIADQARQAVANLNAVLREAGMAAGNLAKLSIYLTDESYLPAFMQAAGGALPSPPPATTVLVVKALASPALFVEIEAVAVG